MATGLANPIITKWVCVITWAIVCPNIENNPLNTNCWEWKGNLCSSVPSNNWRPLHNNDVCIAMTKNSRCVPQHLLHPPQSQGTFAILSLQFFFVFYKFPFGTITSDWVGRLILFHHNMFKILQNPLSRSPTVQRKCFIRPFKLIIGFMFLRQCYCH